MSLLMLVMVQQSKNSKKIFPNLNDKTISIKIRMIFGDNSQFWVQYMLQKRLNESTEQQAIKQLQSRITTYYSQ
ncbi:hypothetical protein TTHERM_000581699 (macronuclear) [Tetrahymena thermophila SB210]|uniref:Uncharacterized protein n=1 Tax=Tetrahymena thermophila (strain SB210) TaxID=312017 RepID=W7XH47_TETTS|nr:hypothetical protein TTHERM_000581699 [Tetrahymena thermophila SB210]EWS73651.1 hypothetical protein TTHERM_000581699 [Tetrahymena thermophila SB210]|eukprot:XP_012653781.1 hypothetical protein TTHERM_000581699 [Tetrahymena thermophila SB210]